MPVAVLKEVTREAMESRGLTIGFSAEALEQVEKIAGPVPLQGEGVRDLRHLKWASIDNADTKDIDQLAFAEDLGGGRRRLLVAIADVAEAFGKGTPLDEQCQQNTVTVYTPGEVNPMLPKQMSTDWTSLNPDADRRALVTELIIGADGEVEKSTVFEAAVRNQAKLDYVTVSDWYENGGEPPAAMASPEMQDQVRLQMDTGLLLGQAAQRRGALAFETERVLPVVENGHLVDLVNEEKNSANEAIAHMMIATNVANARFLHEKGFPVFQRAVPEPARWDRMREVAAQAASHLPEGKEMASELAVLPAEADPAALARFLNEYKERNPEGYGEVSLSMLKLMGGSDYVATAPGEPLQGHFGQGVAGGELGYLHSTAPNRRYPDVVVQRLIKAAAAGQPCPYTMEELEAIADRCNKQESAAKGAERQVRKAAVSHYLASQIGEEYEAVVTGDNPKKGTFVRVMDPPIEGKLVEGYEAVDVGDKLQIRLKAVDLEKGHIDFVRTSEVEGASSALLAN